MPKYDYLFISCVILLTVFGLAMLSSASSDLGKIKFNDTYFYLKHQIIYGLILGIAGFLIASRITYKRLKSAAVPLLIFNIILLILIFTPLGESYNTKSNRWLNFGGFSFQPSEFLKISFIIYLSAWLSNKKMKRQTSFSKGLLPFLSASGIIAGLIFLQPATTIILIVMGAAFIVYFVSGARLLHILGITFFGILILTSIIYFTSYRYNRISSFLKNGGEKQSFGYQLNQSLNAIGSGGLTGVGFGKSTGKYKSLPEPIGDSIFAVIAEELGFIGAAFLIIIFIIMFIRGFLIAKNAPDQFSKLTVIGLISIIAIQTFIHIAAISGLMPLTGVPLPFISFGGTSLAIFLTMTGIIANISRHT